MTATQAQIWKGSRFSIDAGLSPRVLQLFEVAKMDSIIPTAATVDEADVP